MAGVWILTITGRVTLVNDISFMVNSVPGYRFQPLPCCGCGGINVADIVTFRVLYPMTQYHVVKIDHIVSSRTNWKDEGF
jgi:hypothetical protein